MIIFAILLLVCIGQVTTEIYLPSLPAITDYFHVDRSMVQMTISVYLIGMSISPTIFGPLSDLMGRKKIILYSIALGCIMTVCCAMSANIYFLIFSRLIQGVSSGAIVVAARSIMRDLYSGKFLAKKITHVTMLMSFVLSLASLAGGYLQEYFQWRVVFIALLVYFGILYFVMTNIQETLKDDVKHRVSVKEFFSMFKSYKVLFKNSVFMLYSICCVIPFLGMYAYITTSSFLFQSVLGLSPSEYGKLSVYIGIASFIYGLINTKLIKHFQLQTCIYIGAIVVITSGLLLLLFYYLNIKTLISIMAPVLLYYSSLVICLGNGSALALSYVENNYGAARALITTGQFIIGSLSSFIFAGLPILDAHYLAICFVIVGLLIISCVLIANKVKAKDSMLLDEACTYNFR